VKEYNRFAGTAFRTEAGLGKSGSKVYVYWAKGTQTLLDISE